MKATLFTIATLVFSAFAAPVADTDAAKRSNGVGVVSGNAARYVEAPVINMGGGYEADIDIVEDCGAPVGDVGTEVEIPETEVTSPDNEILSIDDLIDLLTDLLDSILGSTGIIDGLLGQVESGECTEEDAETGAIDEIGNIQINLEKIITQLTGAAGISVIGADLDRILSLLQKLTNTLLVTVNKLVGIVGLKPVLKGLLNTVFTLVAQLLALVNKLVAGLLPGLLSLLGPLLKTVSEGLLIPLLTPIFGILGRLLGA